MHSIKKEIFTKFYSHITKDVHSKGFFNSKITIDELIEKQIKTLDKIYQLLSENKEKEAKEILVNIAKKHFAIGICEYAILNAIDVYIGLINEYKEKLNLSQKIISKMYELLQETTFKEYSCNYLKTAMENIKENEENNILNFYDKILFDSLKIHTKELIEVITDNAKCLDEKECNFSKFLNSFSFEVLTTNFLDFNINLKVKNNLLHQYMHEYISYYNLKKYREALHLLQKILSLIQEIINSYFTISNNFKNNSEKTFYQYIASNKDSSVFIMNLSNKENPYCSKKVEEFLIEYFYATDYNFFIINKQDEKINLLFNRNFLYFNEKINEFIETINDFITKNLESKSLKNSHLKIAKIDFSNIKASEEEIEEIFYLINSKLENEPSNEIVTFYDFNENIYELLKEAKEKIKLKKLTLKAIEKENIDIFIHKIFDENKKIAGGEILARIKGENEEYIPAFIFIPILERKNLMTELDKIILKKIYENIDKIKKITPRLFVNIYPPSLNDKEITKLINKLAEKLEENNIEFFLELTEYAITANKNILNLLETTSKLYLAFDDFGTGYTNYELVGELAANKNAKAIKIDGGLVKRIIDSKIHYSIVSSISEFAKELDLFIIYEFVENEEIFNTLKKLAKKLGLEKSKKAFYQGWFFDKAEKI